MLTRIHNGTEHLVTVLDDGFEHRRQALQEPGQVARAIAGTRWNGYLFFGLTKKKARMTGGNGKSKGPVRCAIYTRKSTTEGLESDFNTLDAQREAAEHYIAQPGRRGLGGRRPSATTTAASPAATSSAPRSSACSTTSSAARSTWSSSTRSTASPARCSTSPG